MLLVCIMMLSYLHNNTRIYADPPDEVYPVFERDFVNRAAYLKYLES